MVEIGCWLGGDSESEMSCELRREGILIVKMELCQNPLGLLRESY